MASNTLASYPYFNQGGGNIPITTNGTWTEADTKNLSKFYPIAVYAFAVGNSPEDHDWSVNTNGTGFLNKPGDPHYGKYLHDAIVERPTWPHTVFEFLDEKPKPCGGTLKPFTPDAQEVTIAVNQKFIDSGQYTCGQKFTIDAYPGIIFEIGDGGTFTDENKNPDFNHFDIYVGEIYKKDFDEKFKNQSFFSNVQEVKCN